MITFNQLADFKYTDNYTRIYLSEIWTTRRNFDYLNKREYKQVQRTDSHTYIKNLWYFKAEQSAEKHIAHIQKGHYSYGRYYSINIPYYPHIPNPNGTPGHRTIWVSIDAFTGVTLKIELPNGQSHRHTVRGNHAVTNESLQAEAQKLFNKYYLPDTHPASIWQLRYGATKLEAVKAQLTANKTGWYKAHKWDGKLEVISVEAPAPDATRTILRYLRRHKNIDARPIWDDTKLIKLLKYERRKKRTTAEDAPNIFDLFDQYTAEHDTEEEMENFVMNSIKLNTIYI